MFNVDLKTHWNYKYNVVLPSGPTLKWIAQMPLKKKVLGKGKSHFALNNKEAIFVD